MPRAIEMNQTQRIIETLKKTLKASGKTYSDVGECLGLSEASVKRLFADQHFTLERLEKVCELLDIELVDLIKSMEQARQKTVQLTLDQEKELVSDIKLLLVAHSLMNKWQFKEIVETFDISESEGIQLLAKLDRMKIIELLPGNRVKLLVSRDFTWHPGGPIQKFFEQQLQAEFFNSQFNAKGEYRQFLSGMLSESSVFDMLQKLKKIAGEFNDINRADESLPLTQRHGISLLIATRPWETKAFAQFRREKNKKVL